MVCHDDRLNAPIPFKQSRKARPRPTMKVLDVSDPEGAPNAAGADADRLAGRGVQVKIAAEGVVGPERATDEANALNIDRIAFQQIDPGSLGQLPRRGDRALDLTLELLVIAEHSHNWLVAGELSQCLEATLRIARPDIACRNQHVEIWRRRAEGIRERHRFKVKVRQDPELQFDLRVDQRRGGTFEAGASALAPARASSRRGRSGV